MENNTIQNFTDTSDISIGYLGYNWNIFMISLSCLGIIINLFFGIAYLRRIIKSSKSRSQNVINVSSIEKILCVISIVETFISIGWLINSLFMSKNFQQDQTRSFQCQILGLYEIFFYLFDWIILSCSLYQIKQIVMNPLQLLRPNSLLIKYILSCSIISLLFVILGVFLDIAGKSPMITCFIDISQIKGQNYYIAKNIMFWIFFTSPIILFGFGFYQVYAMTKTNNYKNDKKNKIFFLKYFVYILIYIIIAILLITLYIINYIYGGNQPEGPMKLYIQIVTILSCSTPLFVGIIRLIKTDLLQKLFWGDNEKNENEENLINKDKNVGTFNKFENDLLKSIVIKYYIAISFVLGKARYLDNEDEIEDNTDINTKNSINENNINKEDNKDDKENDIKNNNNQPNENIIDEEKNNLEKNNDGINNETKDENKNEIIENDKDNKNKDEELSLCNTIKINKEESIKDQKISINSINSINNNLLDEDQDINILNKCNQTTEYHITNSEILKDLDLTLNDDIVVLNQLKININITEYCTQLFKKIKEIEEIKEDEIISVFQPKKSNINLIQTFNKNSFYINSTNKEYLIKQVSIDEINFYRSNIINNIYQYLKKNKNSLLLRIQGLYSIAIDDSNKNKKQYIALIHNTYESLVNKDENINLNFSLQNNNVERLNNKKGIKIHKLKIKEFENCIQGDNLQEDFNLNHTFDNRDTKDKGSYKIDLDANELKRLINIKKKDTKFLKKLGVLNYYFFVVEMPMDKKDIEAIFDENGNNKKKKEFQNIKKYLFKSNIKDNKLYSISIVDYYKDLIKL